MNLLVVGASGFLGSNLVAEASDRGQAVTGTFLSARPALDAALVRLDVRDEADVRRVVASGSFDAVVNCAAMTDVDECERDPERAREVNATAAGRLAAACADVGASFVQISTDYVFGGNRTAPYDESAATEPIQVYGETKLAGERAVRDAHDDPLIVRPSFVYGVDRTDDTLSGLVAWIRDRLRDGEPTTLYDNQHITPSRAGATAETTLDLLAAGATGTYHVACGTCTTPYEVGERVRERMDAPAELTERGDVLNAGRAAERPRYTCLDTGRVEETLGRPQPTLAADLTAVADRL